MTYQEFLAGVQKFTFPSQWRPGQAAFNALLEVRPDIAEQVRGTDEDPFHLDNRLPAFWVRVEELWALAGEE